MLVRANRSRYVLGLIVIGLIATSLLAYRQWDRRRADHVWRDAQAATARRDLASAATAWDAYHQLRPGDSTGWLQAARTARRRGRFPDAKRYLAEVVQRTGETDATRLERDLLLVQQGLIGTIDRQLRASVGPDHPDAPIILEALARGYIIAERWADARQACELLRKFDPNDPDPWRWGGWVAERMVQIDMAAELYKRAVELDSADLDTQIAYARVLLRQRNPAEAVIHYETVLAASPDHPDALLGWAECRLEQGKPAEAIPPIERVLQRQPNSSLAAALRGRAGLDAGDAAGAERWLRIAVQAEPSDAEALNALIRCLRMLQHDAEADTLAQRHDALQRDLRRLTELMRQIVPQLADCGPCHEAGVIALRIGRTQQGVNLLQDALRRRGDHRPTHAALAAHYRKVGNITQADFHQTRADAP